jgi:hypothetical protein
MSGRAVWFSLLGVWAILWVGLATTGNAAFAVAAGGLAFAGCVVLSTDYRGAARWVRLQYQGSARTGGLDLKTIRLVGRFGIVIAGAVLALAVAKLITG